MMTIKMTRVLKLLSIGMVALTLVSGPALAGGSAIAPQPCDPQYWETMSARAWMEAEREIMQNQNLIFKPDSVLEYTCFDNMVSHGAKYLGDIFVHTGYFGRVIIPRGTQPHAQEIALQNVVYDAMKKYLEDNFANEFLAKRVHDLRKNPPEDLHNRAPKLIEAKEMKPYSNCKIMAEIWKTSKCANFVDRKDYTKDEDPKTEPFVVSDSFKPFITLKPVGGGKEVAGYDKFPDIRIWPDSCDNMKSEEWVKKDDVSVNKEDQKYKFREPLKKDFEDVRKLVEPGQCEGSGIETGVTIILTGQGGGDQKDKVCTNPGCTLVGQSCQ